MSFDPALPDDSVNVSGGHPLSELATLLIGIAGVVAALALAAAVLVELLVPRLPPGLESRLFAAFAPEAQEEPSGDARLDHLQGLLDRLAGHWPENPYALRATLVDEQEVNAFAFPGGRIVLTRGLLDAVGSENELAFVLAHEIGHFRHRDHLRGLGRGVALSLVVTALAAGGGGSAADLALLAGSLAQRRFDRDQESVADAFALELLAAEFGHVAGAADFFGRAPDAAELLGEKLGGWLSTHPLHAERLERLAGSAARSGFATDGPLLRLPAAAPPPGG